MKILKYHPHRSVLFVTFSVEEGLLLLANPLCLGIVKSCLGAAQALYPVTICHFIVQATHIHLIVVVDNPEDVKNFVRHFKTESAHLLNGVLGREKRTLWCEGYDSPIVLTPVRALCAVTYLYANPAKDNLVESIDDFPGLSSWRMFLRNDLVKEWKRFRRPAVRALPHHSLKSYSQEAERLLKESTTSHEFRIDPNANAWLGAFGVVDTQEQEQINTRLIERVRTLEERADRQRRDAKRSVMGRERLISRTIDLSYRPQRSGRRMCCLSENRALRIRFIGFLKDLYAKARQVAERWRIGDFSLPFPPGLYPPSVPKLQEPLAAW